MLGLRRKRFTIWDETSLHTGEADTRANGIKSTMPITDVKTIRLTGATVGAIRLSFCPMPGPLGGGVIGRVPTGRLPGHSVPKAVFLTSRSSNGITGRSRAPQHRSIRINFWNCGSSRFLSAKSARCSLGVLLQVKFRLPGNPTRERQRILLTTPYLGSFSRRHFDGMAFGERVATQGDGSIPGFR
jgi:hypothetical protein